MEGQDHIKWISTILDELSVSGAEKGALMVEKCGRECLKYSGGYAQILELRKSIEDKNDEDLLFQRYKSEIYENHPNLYKIGRDIYIEYDKCSCHMVIERGIKNPFLCNCTRGYTKQIFETLFGKQVNVQLQKSILNGDTICKQKVSIV